jgi:hypothetical protein
MTDRSELEAKIYDSLGAFNFTACWDVLRLAQARQYLAEHLAADLSAAALPTPVGLTDAERQFLTFALDQAAEEMSLADGFTDEDQAALDKFRRMADEAQQPEEAQRLRRVQCGDCGAVGPVVTGEDGLAYLDPNGQIGHQSQTEGAGVHVFGAGHTTAP